jgi:transposase
LITNHILTSDDFDAAVCVSSLQRSLKKKAGEVLESIEGYMMEPAQKARALMVRDHLEYLDRKIAEIDRLIDFLVAPYEGLIDLLCTIPGVDRRSAITIISEIGTDMSQFASSKMICSWAGLTPSNNESAGKKKSVRISRAGVYLKPALVQVAHAAVKSNKSPYYRVKYERISKRRGKKRAIIAVARMILTAVYSMISTGEVFNPCDLFKIDMPQDLQDIQREKAIRKAKQFLISQGIVDLMQIPA